MTGGLAVGVLRAVRLFSLLFVLAVGALVLRVDAASACSCVLLDPRSALKAADAAFVGTLIEKREPPNPESSADDAVYVFRVERVVKGELPETLEVLSATSGASCGIEIEMFGGRTGLLLRLDGGVWRSSLCEQVEPNRLIAASEPLPAPNGRGSLALLVGGSFGDARTIGLDARGRTLAYGGGGGSTLFLSVCPGSRRAAEIATLDQRTLLAVRDLRTFRLVRQRPITLPAHTHSVALSCADRAGATVYVYATNGDFPARARIVRFNRTRATTVWRGTAQTGAFGRGVAYLSAGKLGRQLLSVDLRTRSATSIGRLPFTLSALTPSSDGRCVAGVAYSAPLRRTSPPSRIVVARIDERTVRSAPLRTSNETGGVAWLDANRFAFFPSTPDDRARVYDRALRLRSTFAGWAANQVAVRGGVAYGLTWNGGVIRARVPGGPARAVRELPSPTANTIVHVPGRVRVARSNDLVAIAADREWTNYGPPVEREDSAFPLARVVTWILGITAFGLTFWRLRQRARSRAGRGAAAFGDSPRTRV